MQGATRPLRAHARSDMLSVSLVNGSKLVGCTNVKSADYGGSETWRVDKGQAFYLILSMFLFRIP